MALGASCTLAVVSLISWGIFQKLIRADSTAPYFIFFFRIALLKDEGVQKVVETPRPTLVDEGGVVSMDVDFGQHPNDQDLEFKITVGIYGHV